MNCLWCDNEIIMKLHFGNLFLPPWKQVLCDVCMEKLEELSGKRCSKCSRISEAAICADCRWWEEHAGQDDPLVWNYSIFAYNDQMQDMIAKWKYRGDYCLGKAFQEQIRQTFKLKFHKFREQAVTVPIPLSDERLAERGFNQSMMLARFLPVEIKAVLTRDHSEKQSKRSRNERIAAANPFRMTDSLNKPVIIVDDIYTTGATLKHAAAVLKENGCPEVYALTLVRG